MAPPKQSKDDKVGSKEGEEGFHNHGHSINIGLPFPVRCTPYEQVNCVARLLAARVFRHHQRLLNLLERYEVRASVLDSCVLSAMRYYGEHSPRVLQMLTAFTAAATEAVDQEVATAETHDTTESRSKHAEVSSP